ncbi:MAG: class I SAM-dependent methyltransferase [Bacteroidia bacterium]|nr:class I SAM-dependent methyltransferase [Bacteroidia bacterium]MCZ2248450.1 class I SAM-dependent methyltransferase [Bacteroidia bacterium]
MNRIITLSPQNFNDYELLDCGSFEKLERFGKYISIRPEPQAVWDRKWSSTEWNKRAHLRFTPTSSSSGKWSHIKESPEQWNISYQLPDASRMIFRLGLTSFKHVGIFPEQAANWDYIFNAVKGLKKSGVANPKVLNLFAYTGGASLAASLAGADVTHVDSIKQVVTWANENAHLSQLSNIRWVVEDALKFVKREHKRGNTYHGIILDPPAFGHGPNGEKWKLEDHINEMVQLVLQLLGGKTHFLILNAYSLGLSSIILENLLLEKAGKHLEIGELYLPSASGYKLPLGVFGRFYIP